MSAGESERIASLESLGPDSNNLGSIALSQHVNLEGQTVAGRSLEFTRFQGTVLLLASLGGTTGSVARTLACEEEKIVQTRDELIATFDVPNMAAVVKQAVVARILPIQVRPNPAVTRRLTERQIEVLRLFAEGYNNSAIAAKFNKSPSVIDRNYSRKIFRKIKASGRTHSVRKSYELEIFKI